MNNQELNIKYQCFGIIDFGILIVRFSKGEHEFMLNLFMNFSTCRATLYAGIPDEWDSSAYSEICSKLRTDLQIGHKVSLGLRRGYSNTAQRWGAT